MKISLPSGVQGTVLVICEKPSVARDLAAVFGGQAPRGGYIPFPLGYISWAVGHMLEQVPPVVYNPEWKAWRWETLPMTPPGNLFKTSVKESCKAQMSVLKDLYSKSQVLINACDAGREGELIWWEIVRHCGWGGRKVPPVLGDKPYFRFWAQSNTPQGLKEAWDGMLPGKDWLGLASSAYSRAESDWLLGMNLSRAATLAFSAPEVEGKKGFWSIGRVQTPVLALICEKDRQISEFVSKPYYEVRISFKASGGDFSGTLLVPSGTPPFKGEEEGKDFKGFLHRQDAQLALDRLVASGGRWTVEDEVKEGKENPPNLFSLTDLQKWCNQAWGWEAKRTLDAAQVAYEEHKTLSYPRTDSSFLPEDSKERMEEVFSGLLSGYFSGKVPAELVSAPSVSVRSSIIFDNKRVSDHYAIVPTGLVPSDFNSDAGRLWLAVVRRFFVSFSAPAKYSTVKRRVIREGDVAVSSGKVYLEQGWLSVDGFFAGLMGLSPKGTPEALAATDGTADFLEAELHEGKTTPPKAYTEATLLGIMENIQNRLDSKEEELRDAISRRGIGTPATRASIIELLLDRGYLRREKKGSTSYLKATENGLRLVDSLKSVNLQILTQPDLTAEWENKLLLMEKGNYSRDQFMGELSELVSSSVSTLKSNHVHLVGPSPGVCPVSGGPVVDRGSYWEFSGFPSVRFYKVIASRPFSFEEMVSVVRGDEATFSGFISKKGSKFSSALRLDTQSGRLSFVFPEKQMVDSGVLCPKSGEKIRDCGGYWEFPGVDAVRFWKQVAKRPMVLDEYLVLVKAGKSELLSGFTSSAGKPFSAMLVLQKDGKVGFEFAPRPAATPFSPGMTGPGKKKKK